LAPVSTADAVPPLNPVVALIDVATVPPRMLAVFSDPNAVAAPPPATAAGPSGTNAAFTAALIVVSLVRPAAAKLEMLMLVGSWKTPLEARKPHIAESGPYTLISPLYGPCPKSPSTICAKGHCWRLAHKLLSSCSGLLAVASAWATAADWAEAPSGLVVCCGWVNGVNVAATADALE
jgi:hypothetical protein